MFWIEKKKKLDNLSLKVIFKFLQEGAVLLMLFYRGVTHTHTHPHTHTPTHPLHHELQGGPETIA